MPTSLLSGRSQLPLIALLLFDLLLAFTCAEVAGWIRFGVEGVNYSHLPRLQAMFTVVCSFLFGVYAPWRGRPVVQQFLKVIGAWFTAFCLLIVYVVATKTSADYSRLWLFSWFVLLMVGPSALRLLLYSWLMKVRRNGRNTRFVVAIGVGRNYQAIKEEFSHDNVCGYRLVDTIDYQNIDQVIKVLATFIEQHPHIDECWLCLPLKYSSAVQPVMYTLRHVTPNIRFMPGVQDLPLLNYAVSAIGDYPALDISCSPMDSANAAVKRVFDVVVGLLILIFDFPVMLLCAIAVKLTSCGPVIFKQLRHGMSGNPVKVYKFRSMVVHDEEGNVTQATRGDARVTKVGAFLRRTSLDELPQFINVLQGHMSIVGPRPHALAHNEYYKDLVASYMKRHQVKPGITGLAQVRGFRGETDTLEKMQRRVECDLEYINNWSSWLDIKIIISTIFKGFLNRNAY